MFDDGTLIVMNEVNEDTKQTEAHNIVMDVEGQKNKRPEGRL